MGTARQARAVIPPVPADWRGKTDDDYPRWCETCREWRAASDYAGRGDRYLFRACRLCRNAEERRRYATEPGYAEKHRSYQSLYRDMNRARLAARRKERYAANADDRRAKARERYHRRKQETASRAIAGSDG